MKITHHIIIILRADFPDIMKSFLVLLKQRVNLLWRVPVHAAVPILDSSDFSHPSIVFDAIKDNSAFLKLVEAQTETQKQLTNVWALTWLTPFAKSVATTKQTEGSSATFSDVLAKMAAFTLEELQHARFKNISPFAMQVMMKARYDSPPVVLTYLTFDRHSMRFSSTANHPKALLFIILLERYWKDMTILSHLWRSLILTSLSKISGRRQDNPQGTYCFSF